MILFLDFDGVLHPEAGQDSGTFCCRPVLWKILRARVDVDVVFSTSWRACYRPEALLDFATAGGGEDLRPRFVGQTPRIPVVSGADDYRRRELECLAWLAASGRDTARWLALDDVDYWFSEASPNVYLVNYLTGLTDDDIPAILARLA